MCEHVRKLKFIQHYMHSIKTLMYDFRENRFFFCGLLCTKHFTKKIVNLNRLKYYFYMEEGPDYQHELSFETEHRLPDQI